MEVVNRANYLMLKRVIYYGSSSQVSIFPLPNSFSIFLFLPPEEDSKKAESREIALFLILLTEVVILGSALLLWVFLPPHTHWVKHSFVKETAQPPPAPPMAIRGKKSFQSLGYNTDRNKMVRSLWDKSWTTGNGGGTIKYEDNYWSSIQKKKGKKTWLCNCL